MSLLKKITISMSAIVLVISSVGCTQIAKKSDIAITQSNQKEAEYSSKIFDASYVHTIDIEFSEEDLQDLLENAMDEKFYSCNITIDGETIENVGIRAKGNSSLMQVAQSDSDRYSFKINFGKYTEGQEYYGLDKMALNNNMADATMMKDYLTYTMMSDFGVAAPEVSYSYVTINGEEWGLYLNVEDIDESFLERNYGEDYGDLYKPETDDMNMEEMGQGPRGAMPEFEGQKPELPQQGEETITQGEETIPQREASPDGQNAIVESESNNAGNTEQPMEQSVEGGEEQKQQMLEKFKEMGPGMFGNTEALGADLVYTDDEESSYANIFEQAETDITEEDKQNLIAALKQLGEGTNLDEVIDIEATLRYFVVHNFVDNYDSYTGNMLHNYYLYQDNEGKLSMLPWDYNLAFGAFGGMGGGGQKPTMPTDGESNAQMPAMPTDGEGNTQMPTMPTDGESNAQMPAMPTDGEGNTQMPTMPTDGEGNTQMPAMPTDGEGNAQMPAMPTDGEGNFQMPNMPQMGGMSSDATSMVNMAIDTPLSGASEEDRPLWSQLINNTTYKEKYHELFDEFITTYIESGGILEEINRVQEMIAPYVQKDPTAFYTYEEFNTGVETLKQFITLRGESIRGQLDGTIPSTTEEQNANPDKLVDASSINISDMGTQGGRQGERKDKRQE